MLTDKAPELLEGIVEVDETYVGGSLKNIHSKKKELLKGLDNKTMVFGAVQRQGKVRVKVIPQTNIEQVTKAIDEFVVPNSFMVSDEHHAYNKVGQKFKHRKVNHRAKEYVRHEDILVHTNNIEGYWNILKKQIVGIHHSVSPKHLQRYCNESAFRYNNRAAFQDERFAEALANCNGSLKYKDLTAEI
jgi:transposase-like protein